VILASLRKVDSLGRSCQGFEIRQLAFFALTSLLILLSSMLAHILIVMLIRLHRFVEVWMQRRTSYIHESYGIASESANLDNIGEERESDIAQLQNFDKVQI
jgi:hypothetical protein